MEMDRSCIRRVVGAITGHCGVNAHMKKLRLSVTSRCACGLEEETGIHVICECSRFSQQRRKFLGDTTVEPSDVVRRGPVALDRFLESTGRFA